MRSLERLDGMKQLAAFHLFLRGFEGVGGTQDPLGILQDNSHGTLRLQMAPSLTNRVQVDHPLVSFAHGDGNMVEFPSHHGVEVLPKGGSG
mmetsp:Transcript_9514/g.20156  ORF Transcript_9514/g.20156 Transcript_9514/m.20156 type:complete len:91 (+) Transcript_9514:319-591(+)